MCLQRSPTLLLICGQIKLLIGFHQKIMGPKKRQKGAVKNRQIFFAASFRQIKYVYLNTKKCRGGYYPPAFRMFLLSLAGG